MTSAFAHMANSVALAFSGSEGKAVTSVSLTLTKEASTSSSLPHGISPGRKIELQEKLLNQFDMLHRIYENGVITPSQFETRRESTFTTRINCHVFIFKKLMKS